MTQLSAAAERVLNAYISEMRRSVIDYAELNSTSGVVSDRDITASIDINQTPFKEFKHSVVMSLALQDSRAERRRQRLQTIGKLYAVLGVLMVVAASISAYIATLPQIRTTGLITLIGVITAITGAVITLTLNRRQHDAHANKANILDFVTSWVAFEQALGFGVGKSLSVALAQAESEGWLTRSDVIQAREILRTRNLLVHEGTVPPSASLALDTLRLQHLTKGLEERRVNLRGGSASS